jgi:hypothetical protein
MALNGKDITRYEMLTIWMIAALLVLLTLDDDDQDPFLDA